MVRLAKVLFFVFLALLVLTFVIGVEINGARRWVGIGALRLQPSEFLKPALAVFVAWQLARDQGLAGIPRTFLLVLPVLGLLALQPDVGMAVVISGVYAAQLFLAGIPWFFVFGLVGLGVLGALRRLRLPAPLHRAPERLPRPALAGLPGRAGAAGGGLGRALRPRARARV